MHALDSVADVIPLRRSLPAIGTEQQLHAWALYADHLQHRLGQAYARLATASESRHVRQFVSDGDGEGRASPCAGDDRLELLARIRAEQLMSLRLLNLLACCADPQSLAVAEGEAGSVLDAQHRRELRWRDLQEARAEHAALQRAMRDQVMRTRDGRSARRLGLAFAVVRNDATPAIRGRTGS